MEQLLLILHVLIAIFLVGLVLMQQGKGAEIGAAFGSGASNTMFGSQGSGSFLMKLTAGLAIVFFVTSLSLGYYTTSQFKAQSKAAIAPLTTPAMPIKQTEPAPAQ